MSNPPSPLAALLSELADVRHRLVYTARRLADGDSVAAAAAIDEAAAQLVRLAGDVDSLEPWELGGAPQLQPEPGPDGPAKVPPGPGPGLERRSVAPEGRSVASTPRTGYADEPLF